MPCGHKANPVNRSSTNVCGMSSLKPGTLTFGAGASRTDEQQTEDNSAEQRGLAGGGAILPRIRA
jgi:hypothetical protein